MKARTILIPVLLSLVPLGGCSWMRHGLYVLFGSGSTRTIEAEFDGLPGHTVAVVVYADQKILYDYPDAPARLTQGIADSLRKNVEDVCVVDPAKVLRFQIEHLYWDALDRTEIGRRLDAEYVLFVSLIEYTARRPGSAGLSQGQITAETKLYQTSLPERDAVVWSADPLLSVTFPEDRPGRLRQSELIRSETESRFIRQLAWKFHEHKEEVQE